MIKLYSFGEKFGVADPSPFVLKVDAYLRMAGLDFESVPRSSNLSKSPKGKLPFIEDNGQIIADSQFIIDYLKQEYGDILDGDFTSEQQAQIYLLTKSLDENLYFTLVYSRWLRDDSWPIVKQAFFGKLPLPLRFLVPGLVRKSVSKVLKGQGLGRHSDQEIFQICEKSLQALTDLLGDKKYFFGDKPCSFDATAFALLAEFLLVDLENQFNQQAKKFSSLVSYCNRIEEKYYSKDN